jgi:MarR family transcriptional regulator, organic hydroperoxide resistance regulator
MNEEKPLGAEIRQTNNLIKAYIDKTLEEQIEEDLTGIEGMTLGYIFRHQDQEITAKDVMARSKVSKATTSQTLNGLEKKGYIQMLPTKGDKRKKVIRLTAKGEKVEAEFKEIFTGISARVKAGITPEEEAMLRNILKKIRENVSEEEK